MEKVVKKNKINKSLKKNKTKKNEPAICFVYALSIAVLRTSGRTIKPNKRKK